MGVVLAGDGEERRRLVRPVLGHHRRVRALQLDRLARVVRLLEVGRLDLVLGVLRPGGAARVLGHAGGRRLVELGDELAGLVGGAGEQFNRENFGLSIGMKNHLSFGLRFPTPRKCSKMGHLDTSWNQNGI